MNWYNNLSEFGLANTVGAERYLFLFEKSAKITPEVIDIIYKIEMYLTKQGVYDHYPIMKYKRLIRMEDIKYPDGYAIGEDDPTSKPIFEKRWRTKTIFQK